MKKPAVHWVPWEKSFDRILAPIEEFIQKQGTSSVLLMICAELALAIVKSLPGAMYQELLHKDMGLELERELVVGKFLGITGSV